MERYTVVGKAEGTIPRMTGDAFFFNSVQP